MSLTTKTFRSMGMLLLLVGIAGCDSDGGNENDRLGSNRASFASEEFAVVDAETAFANIEDATESDPMAMHPVFDGFHRMHRPDRHRGMHLRHILWHIDLTQDQRDQIRQALVRHREIIQEPLEALRAANQDLIDAANEARREVLEKLKAGEITRLEAHVQLQQISARTRAAIRANPDNAPFLRAICQARRELLETIRDILDPAQQIKWDGWVASLPDCA